MTEFEKMWDSEVKKLAEDCVTEPELVRLMGKSEGYEPTEKEKEYLKSIGEKYKDTYGMFYISNMIWQVEHALADSREYSAALSISQIYQVLSSDSYFQNVFEGNEESDEWKTRAALRDGLEKLMHVTN